MNATSTKTEALEIVEGPSGGDVTKEAPGETYGQSPIEKARANYYRWKDIATDALRQYRYAAAALGRELRAEEDHREQQAAKAERGQTRDRCHSGSGKSETA